MRPIDADALVDMLQNLEDKLDKKAFHDMDFQAAYISGIVQEIKKRVIEAPTLDYAPVRYGYWKHEEPVKDDGQKPFVCSTCGLRHPRYGDVDKAYFSYCPWCGTQMDAEMDGGKKDENA